MEVVMKFGLCPEDDPDNRKIWEQMLSGEEYDAAHPALIRMLRVNRSRIRAYNDLMPDQTEEMKRLLGDILGSCHDSITINQPFRCDYGTNISVGRNFFANFNLTILDEGLVTIGDNCFIGPNVGIYTACHPLDAPNRNMNIEWAEPVTIGHNVWIGGGVTICPGVTIGDNCVIGAGSVVTKDVPSDSVYAGNPARLIKKI